MTVGLPNGFPLVKKQPQTSPIVYTVVQNDLGKNGFFGYHLEIHIPEFLKAESTLALFLKQLWQRLSCPGSVYIRTILATGHLGRS